METKDGIITRIIRPIIAIWAMLLFTLLIFANLKGISIDIEIKSTVKWLLSTSVGFYFVGRTIEKISNIIKK